MSSEEIQAYMKEAIKESGYPPLCITPSELTDYVQNVCDADRREGIQAHLIACDECRETFRDLASFAAAAQRPASSTPEPEVEKTWNELRKRLRSDERKSKWLPAGLTGFQPVFSAVCAATACVALTWSLFVQQRFSSLQDSYSSLARQHTEAITVARQFEAEAASARAPQVNLPVFEVLPAGSTDRSSGEQQLNSFVVPASGRFALVLSGAARQPNAEYSVSFRNERRDEVFSSAGLRPDFQGNLVMTFDHGFLPAGRYRVEIMERSLHGFTAVGRYSIRLAAQR